MNVVVSSAEKIRAIIGYASQSGTFQQQVTAFVQETKTLAADGLTLAEVGNLFVALIGLAVAAAAKLNNSGEEKKAFVLEAVGYLYDAIAPAIPLPFFLQPFRAFVRPHVRALVLRLADGVIEAVYRRLQLAPQPLPT